VPWFRFRIGDLFDADDQLAIWLCTLSIAFNDGMHTTRKFLAAERHWENLYEWRVRVSHLNEACLHLERGRAIVEVMQFIEAEGLLEKFDDVLMRYEALRGALNRIRDEATFHYPYKSGARAVARALRQLADQDEYIGSSGPTDPRGTRLLYADQVSAALFINACGGTLEAYEGALAAQSDAFDAFRGFADAALDAYVARRGQVLQLVDPADVDPDRLP
jgi:hypothetical protein